MENNSAKKNYFDFIQGDLEFSLEKLVKKHEENWKDYIEPEIIISQDQNAGKHQINTFAGRMHLGE